MFKINGSIYILLLFMMTRKSKILFIIFKDVIVYLININSKLFLKQIKILMSYIILIYNIM